MLLSIQYWLSSDKVKGMSNSLKISFDILQRQARKCVYETHKLSTNERILYLSAVYCSVCSTKRENKDIIQGRMKSAQSFTRLTFSPCDARPTSSAKLDTAAAWKCDSSMNVRVLTSFALSSSIQSGDKVLCPHCTPFLREKRKREGERERERGKERERERERENEAGETKTG